MANPTRSDGNDPDQAYAFRLRAGPKEFADRLHAAVLRTVETVREDSLDVRDEPRGWVEISPMRRDGRRPS